MYSVQYLIFVVIKKYLFQSHDSEENLDMYFSNLVMGDLLVYFFCV